MLSAGKAVKVSIYLSEGSTHHGASTYSSILDFLFFSGVWGNGLEGRCRVRCRPSSPFSEFSRDL